MSVVLVFFLILQGSWAAGGQQRHGRHLPPHRPQEHRSAHRFLAEATEQNIEALIEKTLERSQTPSVSIAITRKGTLVWARAFGKAFLEPDKAGNTVLAENSTRYWLASVTKTTTALLAAKLWEEGKLDLDRDINSYLPFRVTNPRYPQHSISARMLMTHTSSIQDGGIWQHLLSYKGGDPPVPLGYALREFFTIGGVYNQPMGFHSYAPGQGYDYSNIGVALLGHLCAVLENGEFIDVVTRKVLDPLGMAGHVFWLYADAARLGIALRPGVAMPYTWTLFETANNKCECDGDCTPTDKELKGMFVPTGRYSYPDIPAGMLQASASMILRVGALLGCKGSAGGVQLLQPSTVAMMLSNQTLPGVKIPDNKQGLIFYSSTAGTASTRQQPLWGHNGGDFGASTDMIFTEDGSIGIAVLSNSEAYGRDAAVGDGLSELEQALFEFAWTLPEPQAACTAW